MDAEYSRGRLAGKREGNAMRLMIIAFVIGLLVIVDFAKYGGHYTHMITDTTQFYLAKVLH